ncbi:uncharacterized protein LOC123537041 [Mercenaria mercenaria]|uniref:uncharacterized protein LOC123537041 n=1 Tax=Mercenaria mercenaria TaxID=6596 RepID=UPI00234E93AF|nr:uncharacterized protein LOC123537041 [Mercenaria mercenaria]
MDPIHGIFWSLTLLIAVEFQLLTNCCSTEIKEHYRESLCRTFVCKYNIRLPCSYRCNGHKDCPTGEDEKDCPDTQGGLYLNITPKAVVVKQGETIQVNCSTKYTTAPIIDLKWQAFGNDVQDDMFKQVRLEVYVVTLLIRKAQPENSGTYRCKVHTADGQFTSKLLQIWVNKTASLQLDVGPNRVITSPLNVYKGETVQVNCTARDLLVSVTDLKWEIESGFTIGAQQNVRQLHHDKNTVSLHIANAQPQNSGTYICKLFASFGEVTNVQLKIQIKDPVSKAVANTEKFCRFVCSYNILIACHYKCDGQIQCPFGEDEKDCPEMICEGKFRCNNSRCIDYAYVCDTVNHCNDWSDENRCMMVTTELPPVDSTEEEDNQMIWLKTTVYTVIACTVGIVFLISVIVIAIFRIKMKRAAVRRALRQAERRRRHSNRCESQNNSRTQRNEPVENEPFISAPSPTHFGNIIVNVNNGVQYVPNVEFPVGIQAPPTYSEVMAESGGVGRHSPPPEYSTIDRNPNRVSQIPDSEVHIQLLSESRSVENSESHIRSEASENDHYNIETSGVRHSESVNDYNIVTDSTENAITTSCSAHSNGTNSLGRRETGRQSARQSRNVRSVGSPRRPKQLKVRDGQIVLDDDSSNSSSPETVNRNTQTNPADITTPNQNVAKPAQIQVQAGQIILANQESESSVNAGEADGAVAQGQLDVKDGHIVFKPSGS